jgi:hypothetical protein
MLKWEGCGRKGWWLNLRYYTGICLEDLRKTTNFSVRIAIFGPRFEVGISQIQSRIVKSLNYDARY